MTELLDQSNTGTDQDQPRLSLGTAAARNLATTTKSVPQMQEITSRWLLRVLPWIQASGGTYRVNRRLTYTLGDGRVTFTNTGAQARVIPRELCELPLLRGFDNDEVLTGLADRFHQREANPGDIIVQAGTPADHVYLIVHGRINKIGTGKYGDQTLLGVLADGDYFGDSLLTGTAGTWPFTLKAITACTLLALPHQAITDLTDQSPELRTHIHHRHAAPPRPLNKHGEAAIDLAAGHHGEPDLPGTYVDYETTPREYELSVAQTILHIHTRVADLYNHPMNQTEQQLRLTIEALRERQEHELINNRSFGLLHNADYKQRIYTRTGPPTPDDLDELLALVWKDPACFLAHPRAIAAIGRECNRRGIYPISIDIGGHKVPAWRGVPILPCNKIPITESQNTSVLLFRVGEEKQGVIGLHQIGIPDEYQPGLSVRFMGINDKAIISYLVSAYYSAAVLVPDALGILEDVEIAPRDD